jgi:hypothetical protein
MRLHDRLESQCYEQKLQETRTERTAETKQVERLSAILAKKASSTKAKGLPDNNYTRTGPGVVSVSFFA